MPVPKIIAVLKCLSEDLPQFIIQIIYLNQGEKKDNSFIIVFYISLGLVSFSISLMTAITAKSSSIDE